MIEAVADAGVHSADRRRRRQLGRRHPRAAQRRRRQGEHQHGRRAQPGAVRRGVGALRRAVHRRRDRRQAVRRPDAWEVYTHGGRTPTGIDAVDWAREVVGARRRRDPADQHGPRRRAHRLRPRADARGRRRGRRAGDRVGRRRLAAATSSTASATAAPTPCSPRRSSTTASSRSRRRRRRWPRPGIEMRRSGGAASDREDSGHERMARRGEVAGRRPRAGDRAGRGDGARC